jgi:hypothetical protein
MNDSYCQCRHASHETIPLCAREATFLVRDGEGRYRLCERCYQAGHMAPYRQAVTKAEADPVMWREA